ncbi:MAG: DUF4911 domain-containing protein [Pseudomonadota bacterium]
METIKRYYRMDRRDIYLLRFFLEAYDGISGLSTIDAESGLVVLQIAPGCEEDVAALIGEMQKKTMIQPAEEMMNTNIKLPVAAGGVAAGNEG